jgi:putative modified peptide
MATKKTGASGKAAPLDPKVAGKLLDKLGTDNEFRRLFKKDPKAALIQAGYKLPKGDATAAAELDRICGCMAVQSIAPKADVIKARDTLHSLLTAGLGMTPIQLNIPSTAARRTLK